MSEIMRPLPFADLMERILGEYGKTRSIFGVREDKFYRNRSGVRARCHGTEIDSPVGPAAGPHSQLAGNIVAAYLAGARFVELKTVQTMDGEELRNCVARPCINAADECYNVEWSTELTVQQALEEYVKAWVAAHVLGCELGLDTGLVFNMSVGYSLEGIQSPKIDCYLDGLKDAAGSRIWDECLSWLDANRGRFAAFGADELVRIPSQVSDSVTLSTLHGCPREEIERIAHYLLTEKHLHTNIKCNPTLLGYAPAREILDAMGYGYVSFDDHHFKEDLQFDDAVAMIGRLQGAARAEGLDMGVKITNTFPVDIARGELPGEEMYMSGRALFPLSVNVAARLAEAVGRALPISYSGGADAFNIADLLACGIRPVTVATTLLKPGGYERLTQLASLAEGSVDAGRDGLDVAALARLAESARALPRHRKGYREQAGRKSDKALALIDCAEAPCSETGCPIGQQIPAYLEQVAHGDLARAFEVIVNDNVLPSVTGAICDHQCQNRCTRLDYDDPVQIRAAKKAASEAAQAAYIGSMAPSPLRSATKVLVVGAGPAGLAAATYLRRNGLDVTVRETRDRPFGIVSHVIPAFRIRDDDLALDLGLAEASGVRFEFGAAPDYDLEALRGDFGFVILATGAWKEARSAVPLDGTQVVDALDFLARSKESGLALGLGRRVAVIGGGDVAMDCARAAVRNKGVTEAVVVYRRTREFMPAQREEVELAERDGVRFQELHAPRAYADGLLHCDVMRLGDFDASGRRGILATGEQDVLPFDTVVVATGATVDTAPFSRNGIALDERGHAVLGASNETSRDGVYIVGDAKAGPATVVKAMADAKAAASDILAKLGLDADFRTFGPQVPRDLLLGGKGVLAPAAPAPDAGAAPDAPAPDAAPAVGLEQARRADAMRCLCCNVVCEVCVDVCPNRANVSIDMGEAHLGFAQRHQVLHLDGLCNECGNCGTFCPTAGRPYLDKLTLYASEEDFDASSNRGFLLLGPGRIRARLEEGAVIEGALGDERLPFAHAAMIERICTDYPYLTGLGVQGGVR
ncbi:MAG: putative selenate reductase subunit YgfK [Coriobacteriales bacterium]|jgi:putative selenate reductase|nr:putative selenate reductase subunit YgfK [Coriobacteriales bacterium]